MLFTSTVCCLCTHSSTLQPAAIIQWEQRLLLEFQHAFTWAHQVELTYCTFVWLHLSKQEPGKIFHGIWGEDKCVATKQPCVCFQAQNPTSPFTNNAHFSGFIRRQIPGSLYQKISLFFLFPQNDQCNYGPGSDSLLNAWKKKSFFEIKKGIIYL